MGTETSMDRSRKDRSGSFVILLLVACAGVYAGMRWHEPIQRWLVPSAGAPEPRSDGGARGDRKQLWTCGMHPQVIQDHLGDCPICHMKLTPLVGEGAASPHADAGVVVDSAVVQNMGVRTAEATLGALSQIIRASATIIEPESAHRDINLRVSGWIQTLYADTDGMLVRKGDPLFDLYSPELRLAIEELISARRSVKGLEGDGNALTRETAESLVSAAEGRLLALDLTTEQIRDFGSMEHAPSVVTIVSPIDAHITEKAGVYAGSSVMAGQRVFRLSQRSTMWIQGRVPEGDLGRVRIGQRARARVDAYPGRLFEGDVIFIHPHLDETTRTALVRMVISNQDGALHEGMFATVEIDIGTSEQSVLVPREAVIDTGESQVVIVSAGKGHFEPRRVVMGRSGDHGLVEIQSGLKPGEHVVASGQFLLDSESRLREAIAKFLAPKENSTAAPAKSPTIDVNAARVDAIVAAYLPLSESLGAVEKENAPLILDGLVSSLRALGGEVTAPQGVRLIGRAESAAEAMRGQPLERQRELFKGLSAALIELVDAMAPSATVAESLYIVNCPMAKADWLQRTREVANPYYAQEMKECGSVVRQVGAKGGN